MRAPALGAIVVALVVSLSGRPTFAQQQVSRCGETISTSAVLAGDLDCSSFGAAAVILADNAKLDLAGHTLTASDYQAVGCIADCTIVGSGGTIAGASGTAITARQGRLAVTDLTISSNGDLDPSNLASGMEAKIVTASGVTVVGGAGFAVYAERRLKITDSVLVDNGGGGFGFIYGSGHANRAKITNSTISGNGQRSWGRRVVIVGSSFVGNSFGGVQAWKLRATDSTFSDNSGGATCGSLVLCPDIESGQKPSVANVSCETSVWVDLEFNPIGNFGICSLD